MRYDLQWEYRRNLRRTKQAYAVHVDNVFIALRFILLCLVIRPLYVQLFYAQLFYIQLFGKRFAVSSLNNWLVSYWMLCR